jgi:D-sedoheptulose 7-phosphate isomerase
VASLDLSQAEELIRHRLSEGVDNLQALPGSPCVAQSARAAALIVECLSAGGKVMFCGNGGSSMDAGHLAGELMGRFYRERQPLAAISLADATATLTAIANDYAYEEIFSRQVRGMGHAGDVLVCLTTSGNSLNVVRAIEAAKDLDIATVVLTGAGGGRVSEMADICIQVTSSDTPRVQEGCMHLGHSICELVEASILAARCE